MKTVEVLIQATDMVSIKKNLRKYSRILFLHLLRHVRLQSKHCHESFLA